MRILYRLLIWSINNTYKLSIKIGNFIEKCIKIASGFFESIALQRDVVKTGYNHTCSVITFYYHL